MKQKIIFQGIVLLFLITIIQGGCTQETVNSVETPTENEEIDDDEFNIYYSFGVGEKNILDTKNNHYVKDMICDEQVEEYEFSLTESQKKELYNAILENDLFHIKEEFTENCNSEGVCIGVEPLSTSTLKIIRGKETKTIKWSVDYFDRDDPELKKFQNIEKVIQNIISQKEDEMDIEQPDCGYL